MVALIVPGVALVAFFLPVSFLWIQTAWITPLLAIVMFGMGLSLNFSDFSEIVRRPKDVLIGSAAQFIVMPALAYALGRLFHLEPALLVGVALVGACPGGTASNVITYLSKGDLALSVAITSLSTLLAPIATPLLTYFLLRETVAVDVLALFLMICQVVAIPVALGFLVERYWKSFAAKLAKGAPMVSIVTICLIVACVVSHSADKIRAASAVIFTVVILHNLLGYLIGFLLAWRLKMPVAKIKALTIEVGMQNSGLASALATQAFQNAPLAAAPGAIFSVWHNISGAILAAFFKRWKTDSNQPAE